MVAGILINSAVSIFIGFLFVIISQRILFHFWERCIYDPLNQKQVSNKFIIQVIALLLLTTTISHFWHGRIEVVLAIASWTFIYGIAIALIIAGFYVFLGLKKHERSKNYFFTVFFDSLICGMASCLPCMIIMDFRREGGGPEVIGIFMLLFAEIVLSFILGAIIGCIMCHFNHKKYFGFK